MTNIGFGGFQLDRRCGCESGACCQVQKQENWQVCEAKEGLEMTKGYNDTPMVYSQFQKTYYQTQGRDFCPRCKKSLEVGDKVLRKDGGNKTTIYHEECYAKTVIEIE